MRRLLIQSAVVGIALLLPCIAFAQFFIENPLSLSLYCIWGS
jgi:hypothetical protein